MTPGGWIIMLTSVSAATALFVWCIIRVLRTPHPEEKLHAPPNIEHEEPK